MAGFKRKNHNTWKKRWGSIYDLRVCFKKKWSRPKKDVVLDDSIKFDLMAGAFTSGTADYVTLFEPTASLTQNENKGYIVASVGEAAGEIPYTAYFAKKAI